MVKEKRYLTYHDVRKDLTLAPLFDECVALVLADEARALKRRGLGGDYQPNRFKAKGQEIVCEDVLEYYLMIKLKDDNFDFEKAKEFSEKMRKLVGWQLTIDRVLEDWVNINIRGDFFYPVKNEYGYTDWLPNPDIAECELPEDYMKFACYVAVNFSKFGMSHDSITVNDIFRYVTTLGSKLPTQLKKFGSGELPKEITEYKDDVLSCKANDVFGTVKIILKEENETSYRNIFQFLNRLLSHNFPKSYQIDFRSPQKEYLPIKGLAKKGVNQLFANAVRYESLHGLIEEYARLAMTEDEWYSNLNNEHCAMTGTFAVFGLGLADECYHDLVCEYLRVCDGEHQGVHGAFVLAYVQKYGFTDKGLELYELCRRNIQHLPTKLVQLHKKLR